MAPRCRTPEECALDWETLTSVTIPMPAHSLVSVPAEEPNRALVLRNWGAFVLEPDGYGGTRFLIRSTISSPDIPVWAAALNFTAFELPHFIMQRRMMLGIKALAEQHSTIRSAR